MCREPVGTTISSIYLSHRLRHMRFLCINIKVSFCLQCYFYWFYLFIGGLGSGKNNPKCTTFLFGLYME